MTLTWTQYFYEITVDKISGVTEPTDGHKQLPRQETIHETFKQYINQLISVHIVSIKTKLYLRIGECRQKWPTRGTVRIWNDEMRHNQYESLG